MAAKNYSIQLGTFNAYIARRTSQALMSDDRVPIDDGTFMMLVDFYMDREFVLNDSNSIEFPSMFRKGYKVTITLDKQK